MLCSKNKDRSEEKTKANNGIFGLEVTNLLEWPHDKPSDIRSVRINSEYTDMEQSPFVNTPEELATPEKFFDYKYNGFVAE